MREPIVVRSEFYKDSKLNPDRKLYLLSKGGFPFDLFWSKQLESGSHSQELAQELTKRGVLDLKSPNSDGGPIFLKNVPPGTYASRLFGDQNQITKRITDEISHTEKNLKGDITIYLMHRDDGDSIGFKTIKRPQTSVATIMRALNSEEIISKFWGQGWSNWQNDRVSESINLAKSDTNFSKPLINSPYFSLFEMSSRTIHALGIQVTHQEMMDHDFLKDIKIMPYSPLGGFSILDKPEPKWENAKKSALKKFEDGDPYWKNVYHAIFTEENEARWNRVVAFTKEFNENHGAKYTVDQMMNAYVLAHPRTDLLAIGAITTEQVARTVKALQLSKFLSAQDLEYLYSGIRK